jgi:NagD protein
VLSTQTPNGSAYVVGDNGLRTALLEAGYTLTDTDPDYVVVGETTHFTYEMIEKAINLVYGYAPHP